MRPDRRNYNRRDKLPSAGAMVKRRAVWFRQYPLCGDRIDGRSKEHSLCARAGLATLAVDMDHIIPLSRDDSVDDESNWQSLCKTCHNLKTVRERGDRTRQKIGADGWPVREHGEMPH